MRVVCISDTHGQHWKLNNPDGTSRLPEGDVLVHAGDFTSQGSIHETHDFLEWFGSIEGYEARILIAGNHDFLAERSPRRLRFMLPHTVTYLQDSGCEVDGMKFWGSPWTPRFGPWAFMKERRALQDTWRGLVPHDVDVLITHGPEYGLGDLCLQGDRAGDPFLGELISRRPSIKLHVFGHIHEQAGRHYGDGHMAVNASLLNERYELVNEPIVVEVKK